ncbi:unnamed protein product [Orchesella dallaii]|uniref:MOSC domain-containing protein n=1 Tax=Orchesella dallaii TaxID=48710 RepID=A0ABP1S294_9HEXA
MSLLEGIKLPASTLAISAGACVAGGIVGGLIMKRTAKTTDQLPEKWIKVGEIKKLNVYPVKSMSGVSVNEAVVARLGLQGPNNPLLRDRVFAIVNAKGVCVTQKQCPKFAKVEAKVDGDQLHLTYLLDPSINIAVDIPTSAEDAKKEKDVTVMGEKLKAVDCGDKVAAWLTKLSELPDIRLMYHLSEEPQRSPVKRNSRFHTYREEHTGTFQDETSYMLMTDESLAALNAELETPVSHANFRPSIIVGGIPEPFSEDFWGFIRIGGEGGPVMKASLPCQRFNLLKSK